VFSQAVVFGQRIGENTTWDLITMMKVKNVDIMISIMEEQEKLHLYVMDDMPTLKHGVFFNTCAKLCLPGFSPSLKSLRTRLHLQLAHRSSFMQHSYSVTCVNTKCW